MADVIPARRGESAGVGGEYEGAYVHDDNWVLDAEWLLIKDSILAYMTLIRELECECPARLRKLCKTALRLQLPRSRQRGFPQLLWCLIIRSLLSLTVLLTSSSCQRLPSFHFATERSPIIRDTLYTLRKEEESLKQCSEYDNLLQAIDDSSRKLVHHKNRRRIEEDNSERVVPTVSPAKEIRDTSEQAGSLPPSAEKREMKYMYTDGPASDISKWPEPFRTAIQNGGLWKWERSQGLPTTGCWANLFPTGDTQDVSFTIWCSHEDGYQLNEYFGLQLTLSS